MPAPFFMAPPDMIFKRTGANTPDSLWRPFVSQGADGAEVVRYECEEKGEEVIVNQGRRINGGRARIELGASALRLIPPFLSKSENDGT